MQPKTPKLLEDIRAAAAFIVQATAKLTLDDYRQNAMIRFAVERNFEIIGEAANRLSRVDAATAAKLGQTAQIVAFRNVLIHGYDRIDDAMVWKIARDDVPALLRDATLLLKDAGQ
jgi:uncharacterized protein with HEPN domain